MVAASKLEDELRKLGERRKQIDADRATLAKDTRKLVRRAKGRLTMEHIAELAGVRRETLYTTYVRPSKVTGPNRKRPRQARPARS